MVSKALYILIIPVAHFRRVVVVLSLHNLDILWANQNQSGSHTHTCFGQQNWTHWTKIVIDTENYKVFLSITERSEQIERSEKIERSKLKEQNERSEKNERCGKKRAKRAKWAKRVKQAKRTRWAKRVNWAKGVKWAKRAKRTKRAKSAKQAKWAKRIIERRES